MEDSLSMNRRAFIGSAAAAGFGIKAAAGYTAEAELNKTIKERSTKRGKTIVKVLYLAKPVPTWPFPNFNPQDDIAKIDAVLKDFTKSWEMPVEFLGGELLRVPEHVHQVIPTLKEADGLLLFNLTSTVGAIIDRLLEFNIPTVLFSQPFSGHDWARIGDLQRQGKKIDVIASSSFEDLEPYIRMVDTMRKLKQSKLICIRPQGEKSEFIRQLETVTGVTISMADYSRLQGLYDSIPASEIEQEAMAFKKNAVKVIEPGDTEIIDSFRLYRAIQNLLIENGANGITIDCLGGFRQGLLSAYPCVAWSKLNDAGLHGVCEADIPTAITQMLLGFYAGKPGFVSDPVFDTHTDSVIHAHCVCATKMDGEHGPAAPYLVRSHMEDDKGVSIQVKMRIGQEITLAEFADARTMLISTGKIIENPDSHRGCRTKVTTVVPNSERFLLNYSTRLHRVLFYGNYLRDMQRMGRLMGFDVVHEV